MQVLDVSKFLGSRERPMFSIAELRLKRTELRDLLGADPVVAEEPGWGLADYWATQYECGLKVFYEFYHDNSGSGIVYADMPCPQHVCRHLRLWEQQLHIFPDDMFALDRDSMITRFGKVMPELHQLNAYQVWRQGDDGNQVPVGYPTTQRDAQCWLSELEVSIHKQIYWVARCADATSGS